VRLLNLGCGTKVSGHPDVVNIDWSIYLRLKRNPVLRRLTPMVVKGERLRRFASLPDNILVHNLANGIPFPDESVDAVYHSHLLEHLDREVAGRFLREVRRVLKPGGSLHFVEHGLAPDEGVQRWQHRLEPVQKRLFGGCHLTRPVVPLIEEAGFTIGGLDVFYEDGAPKFLAAQSLGVATAPAAAGV